MKMKKLPKKLPKINLNLFCFNNDGELITCDDGKDAAILKVAKTVTKKFSYGNRVIEAIIFSPNIASIKGLVNPQFAFLCPLFVIYIRVTGLKEKIKLVGYIDLLLSEVHISHEEDKKILEENVTYNERTAVQDVAQLLIRVINHKLNIIAHRISNDD